MRTSAAGGVWAVFGLNRFDFEAVGPSAEEGEVKQHPRILAQIEAGYGLCLAKPTNG